MKTRYAEIWNGTPKPGRQWVSRGRVLTETKDTNSLFGKVEGLINEDGNLTYGIEVDTLFLSKTQKEKDEYWEEEVRIEAEAESNSYRIANEELEAEEANKLVPQALQWTPISQFPKNLTFHPILLRWDYTSINEDFGYALAFYSDACDEFRDLNNRKIVYSAEEDGEPTEFCFFN